MSLRIRSEGALDRVEDAIARYEKIEQLLRFSVESVVNELPSPSIDGSAVARLEKLDPAPLARLREVQKRVAELARKQLRERDIEPTSPNVDDLLVQLIARANARRTPRKSAELGRRVGYLAVVSAMPIVLVLLFISDARPLEIVASMGVLAIAAILGYLLSRPPRN